MMIRGKNIQQLVRLVLMAAVIGIAVSANSAPAHAGWLSDLGHKISKAVNDAVDWYMNHAKPMDPQALIANHPV